MTADLRPAGSRGIRWTGSAVLPPPTPASSSPAGPAGRPDIGPHPATTRDPA